MEEGILAVFVLSCSMHLLAVATKQQAGHPPNLLLFKRGVVSACHSECLDPTDGAECPGYICSIVWVTLACSGSSRGSWASNLLAFWVHWCSPACHSGCVAVEETEITGSIFPFWKVH